MNEMNATEKGSSQIKIGRVVIMLRRLPRFEETKAKTHQEGLQIIIATGTTRRESRRGWNAYHNGQRKRVGQKTIVISSKQASKSKLSFKNIILDGKRTQEKSRRRDSSRMTLNGKLSLEKKAEWTYNF